MLAYFRGIDPHMHSSGDRATRNILGAVEQARETLGRSLGIEVTTSHLFSVADSDIGRFRELGVHATFTPHCLAERRTGTPGDSMWTMSPLDARISSERQGFVADFANYPPEHAEIYELTADHRERHLAERAVVLAQMLIHHSSGQW